MLLSTLTLFQSKNIKAANFCGMLLNSFAFLFVLCKKLFFCFDNLSTFCTLERKLHHFTQITQAKSLLDNHRAFYRWFFSKIPDPNVGHAAIWSGTVAHLIQQVWIMSFWCHKNPGQINAQLAVIYYSLFYRQSKTRNRSQIFISTYVFCIHFFTLFCLFFLCLLSNSKNIIVSEWLLYYAARAQNDKCAVMNHIYSVYVIMIEYGRPCRSCVVTGFKMPRRNMG